MENVKPQTQTNQNTVRPKGNGSEAAPTSEKPIGGTIKTINEIEKTLASAAFDIGVLARVAEALQREIKNRREFLANNHCTELELIQEILGGIYMIEDLAERLNNITRKLEKTAKTLRKEYGLGRKTRIPEIAEQIETLIRKSGRCEAWL